MKEIKAKKAMVKEAQPVFSQKVAAREAGNAPIVRVINHHMLPDDFPKTSWPTDNMPNERAYVDHLSRLR